MKDLLLYLYEKGIELKITYASIQETVVFTFSNGDHLVEVSLLHRQIEERSNGRLENFLFDEADRFLKENRMNRSKIGDNLNCCDHELKEVREWSRVNNMDIPRMIVCLKNAKMYIHRAIVELENEGPQSP